MIIQDVVRGQTKAVMVERDGTRRLTGGDSQDNLQDLGMIEFADDLAVLFPFNDDDSDSRKFV